MALTDLAVQFGEYEAELKRELFKGLDRGLDKAAERLIQELEKNSPSDPETTENKYKDSWVVKEKYRNLRIIGNTKRSKDNIPLSMLLEYQGDSRGHIRNTYTAIEDELQDIIKSEVSK